MSNQNTKQSYFNPQDFIDRILKKTGMDHADAQVKIDLSEELAEQLMMRMTATITSAFTENELFLLKNMLDDHPELDEIDAIMIIAANMPDMSKKLEEAVQSLEIELTQDYNDIERAIANRK